MAMPGCVDIPSTSAFANNTSPSNMFKSVVVVVATLSAVVLAKPQGQQGPTSPPIPIISYENDGVNFDGSYKWRYETGNEITAEEQGQVKNFGVPDQEIASVQGGYAYTAPDGTRISITYTADENGFVPVGDILPTPPAIPEAILRALEYNAAHPEEDNAGQGNRRRRDLRRQFFVRRL